MSFCMNCGTELPNGARYCSNCGTRVGETSAAGAKQKGQEGVMQCPNCGSHISRMSAICSFCGAQITGKRASLTVQQFAEELAKIEAEAEDFSEHTRIGGILNPLNNPAYLQYYGNSMGTKSLDRKVSFIKSFPIPNTVEEITEFILLAVASIDVQYGKKSISNSIFGSHGGANYSQVMLASTWVNKLEQAYHKAEIAFPNDPSFPKIKSIYEDKMKELKRL